MKRYKTENRQWAFWLGGMTIGAAAMYLADPVQGKRRREQMQSRMTDASSRTGNAINFALQDTGSRLSAWQSQARNVLNRSIQPVSNQLLESKITAKLAKLCRFPGGISAQADQGCVTLTGSIMPSERAKLIRALYKVPGVLEIRDRLETSPSASFDSDLKHGSSRVVEKSASAVGQTAALLGSSVIGATRRLPVGTLLAVAGLGYLIRSLSNGSFKRTLSGTATAPTQVINIQRSIEIQASPETVFDIWSNYENFPHFMSHVVEVRDLGMQRSHWTVKGPAGVELEWYSLTTKCLPPTILAWKSEPGSEVEHSGSVRFESANGGTRATVRMTYTPASGTLGQGLAALLSDDPAKQLETDLLQMKHFIESRNLPREIAQTSSSAGQVLH